MDSTSTPPAQTSAPLRTTSSSSWGSQGSLAQWPRDAKGEPRDAKVGPRQANRGQHNPSRPPKWCQNESKMSLATVKIQIVKMSKNHWFFHSKWLAGQPRTSQNWLQRVHSGQMAGPVAGQKAQMAGQVAGQGRSGGRSGPRAGSLPEARARSGRSGGRSGPFKGSGRFRTPKIAEPHLQFLLVYIYIYL